MNTFDKIERAIEKYGQAAYARDAKAAERALKRLIELIQAFGVEEEKRGASAGLCDY